MIYTPKITSDIQINSLRDLVKLNPFLEDSTLKINKSQIARELGKDRRTVDKYLKGYEKPTARRRSSCIDDYYDIIKDLLSDENQQIFYYKRVLSLMDYSVILSSSLNMTQMIFIVSAIWVVWMNILILNMQM